MVDKIEYMGECWEYDEVQDLLTVTFADGSKAQCPNLMEEVTIDYSGLSNMTFKLHAVGEGSAQNVNHYGTERVKEWPWRKRCYYMDGIWVSKHSFFTDTFTLLKVGDDGQNYTSVICSLLDSNQVDALVTNEVKFVHNRTGRELCGVVVDNEIYSPDEERPWYRLNECTIVSDRTMDVGLIEHEDVERAWKSRNAFFDNWLSERFHLSADSFCSNCGHLLREGEYRSFMIYGEQRRYCDECCRELVHTCGHCGRETISDGYWVDELGMWVEARCYDDALRENGYSYCDYCDRIYRVGDEDGEDCCPTCARTVHWNAMEHEYNYVPPMRFTHADKSVTSVERPGTRYIGCEMEMEGGDCYRYRNTLHLKLKKDGYDKHVYFMHDGSLTDGCETATVPIELDYALTEYPFDTIHKVAQKCSMRAHQTDTCGLHIHVNRASIPDFELTMAKVLLTFDKFYDKLLTFGRRRQKDRPEHWCAKPNADIQKSDTPMELRDKLCVARDHYRAVNMLPRNTVEFRLWKGTHNPDTIRATIDFLSTLIDVCAETDLEELYDWTWEEFIAAAAPKWKLEHTAEYTASRGLM